MIYLGYQTFTAKPASKAAKSSDHGLFTDYISTVFLTITNPATILSFVAVFAGLGLGNTNSNYISASFMVFGVFIGSALWWLVLSAGVGLIKDKVSTKILQTINQISGIIILFLGSLALLSLIKF